MRKILLLFSFFVAFNLFANVELKSALWTEMTQHHFPLRYNDAKHILYSELFSQGDSLVEDIYCGRVVKIGSGAINVEHSWPKSRFNKKIKKDIQTSDLHHLYPVDAQANSHRGNDFYAEVEGGAIAPLCVLSKSGRAIGTQDIYAFEPPDKYKGDIARGHFYFSIRYGVEIDSLQEKFLRKWHKQDPVDVEEYFRNEIIESVQGNRNPFIDYPSLVNQIGDF